MATVKISDALKARLSLFAKRRGKTPEAIANEAITSYLRDASEPAQIRPRGIVGIILPDFAAAVQRAANSATEAQRFGDNKVFISEIAKSMGVARGDMRAFKKRLLEAHEAGLVDLARADLVEAMDPRQVDESEIVDNSAWGNEQYHFVRI